MTVIIFDTHDIYLKTHKRYKRLANKYVIGNTKMTDRDYTQYSNQLPSRGNGQFIGFSLEELLFSTIERNYLLLTIHKGSKGSD